jgi:hypothetical protein
MRVSLNCFGEQLPSRAPYRRTKLPEDVGRVGLNEIHRDWSDSGAQLIGVIVAASDLIYLFICGVIEILNQPGSISKFWPPCYAFAFFSEWLQN